MVSGAETPTHENPEWEKARQALASISKAGAGGSSKASSTGPVSGAQVRGTEALWGMLWERQECEGLRGPLGAAAGEVQSPACRRRKDLAP